MFLALLSPLTIVGSTLTIFATPGILLDKHLLTVAFY